MEMDNIRGLNKQIGAVALVAFLFLVYLTFFTGLIIRSHINSGITLIQDSQKYDNINHEYHFNLNQTYDLELNVTVECLSSDTSDHAQFRFVQWNKTEYGTYHNYTANYGYPIQIIPMGLPEQAPANVNIYTVTLTEGSWILYMIAQHNDNYTVHLVTIP